MSVAWLQVKGPVWLTRGGELSCSLVKAKTVCHWHC